MLACRPSSTIRCTKPTTAISSKNNTNVSAFRPRTLSTATTAARSDLPPHLLNIPPTKISTLGNKIRVATEESHVSETATIGVWIDAGSAYETEENNGVAHFLEHMAFKGTKNRSREALEVEIENMGGSLNAYTSREQTVYYAKVFKNDVPKAIDILSDILTNSTFDNASIESERSTILREMEEVSKDNSEVIFDHLHAGAFQGTSLGRTILGPEANVKAISRDHLVNYIKNHYQGSRMVVVGAGAVQHSQLVDLSTKAFGHLPPGELTPKTNQYAIPFTGCLTKIEDQTMSEAHVVVGVESVGWSSPDYFTFMVIQTIVGSWDRQIGGGKNLSSRLCEFVATEELAHSFSSFNTCYNNTGIFGAYFVAEPSKLIDMTRAIFAEWQRIGNNVSQREVERAKNRLKASILMSYDGNQQIAEDIGRQVLTLGRRMSPAEIFLRINAVTVEDVRRVVTSYCEDVEPAVAAIGPTEQFPDYNWVKAWTFWRNV